MFKPFSSEIVRGTIYDKDFLSILDREVDSQQIVVLDWNGVCGSSNPPYDVFPEVPKAIEMLSNAGFFVVIYSDTNCVELLQHMQAANILQCVDLLVAKEHYKAQWDTSESRQLIALLPRALLSRDWYRDSFTKGAWERVFLPIQEYGDSYSFTIKFLLHFAPDVIVLEDSPLSTDVGYSASKETEEEFILDPDWADRISDRQPTVIKIDDKSVRWKISSPVHFNPSLAQDIINAVRNRAPK